MPSCPQCYTHYVVQNGHLHNGKQGFKCCQCGRQLVENPTNIMISDSTKALIDRLLLERIS